MYNTEKHILVGYSETMYIFVHIYIYSGETTVLCVLF